MDVGLLQSVLSGGIGTIVGAREFASNNTDDQLRQDEPTTIQDVLNMPEDFLDTPKPSLAPSLPLGAQPYLSSLSSGSAEYAAEIARGLATALSRRSSASSDFDPAAQLRHSPLPFMDDAKTLSSFSESSSLPRSNTSSALADTSPFPNTPSDLFSSLSIGGTRDRQVAFNWAAPAPNLQQDSPECDAPASIILHSQDGGLGMTGVQHFSGAPKPLSLAPPPAPPPRVMPMGTGRQGNLEELPPHLRRRAHSMVSLVIDREMGMGGGSAMPTGISSPVSADALSWLTSSPRYQFPAPGGVVEAGAPVSPIAAHGSTMQTAPSPDAAVAVNAAAVAAAAHRRRHSSDVPPMLSPLLTPPGFAPAATPGFVSIPNSNALAAARASSNSPSAALTRRLGSLAPLMEMSETGGAYGRAGGINAVANARLHSRRASEAAVLSTTYSPYQDGMRIEVAPQDFSVDAVPQSRPTPVSVDPARQMVYSANQRKGNNTSAGPSGSPNGGLVARTRGRRQTVAVPAGSSYTDGLEILFGNNVQFATRGGDQVSLAGVPVSPATDKRPHSHLTAMSAATANAAGEGGAVRRNSHLNAIPTAPSDFNRRKSLSSHSGKVQELTSPTVATAPDSLSLAAMGDFSMQDFQSQLAQNMSLLLQTVAGGGPGSPGGVAATGDLAGGAGSASPDDLLRVAMLASAADLPETGSGAPETVGVPAALYSQLSMPMFEASGLQTASAAQRPPLNPRIVLPVQRIPHHGAAGWPPQPDAAGDPLQATSPATASSGGSVILVASASPPATSPNEPGLIQVAPGTAAAPAASVNGSGGPVRNRRNSLGGSRMWGVRPRRAVTESGVTRYLCEWEGCGKSFSTSGHLARHGRIHRNIKPFECDFPGCTSRFARRDNLRQHRKTHNKPAAPSTEAAEAETTPASGCAEDDDDNYDGIGGSDEGDGEDDDAGDDTEDAAGSDDDDEARRAAAALGLFTGDGDTAAPANLYSPSPRLVSHGSGAMSVDV